MHRPRLIASDVDGTLLTPLERMSERTRGVLARVIATDVPFVLVSGRPPRWIPRIAAQGGLSGLAVCANGAVVYDLSTGRVQHVAGIEPILLNDVAAALATVLPHARLAAERIGADDSDPPFVIEHAFSNPWDHEPGPASDGRTVTRAEVLGHTATKLLVSDPDMTSDEMATAASAVLDDGVDITFSTNAGLIEVAPKGVTKATGLAIVAEEAGVAAEDVIAFGDMPNDIEMLRWSGHGVAMANAHAAVHAVADEVTATNSEDGVAQVLERWF